MRVTVTIVMTAMGVLPQPKGVLALDSYAQAAGTALRTGADAYQAALYFESLGDFAQATKAYDQAFQFKFNPSTALVRKASIFLRTGQYERALAGIQEKPSVFQDCTELPYRALDFLNGEWIVTFRQVCVTPASPSC